MTKRATIFAVLCLFALMAVIPGVGAQSPS